jgi:hypothetical protein
MAQSVCHEAQTTTQTDAMSGPITAGYFLMHGLLLLSARALHEARAMKQEFGAVRDQLQRREEELAHARRQQREARLDRLTSMRRRADQQAARLAALISLGDALSTHVPDLAARIPAHRLVAPVANDDASWTGYVAGLESAVRVMETLLGDAGSDYGAHVRASVATTSSAASIDEVLSAYVLQRQLKPGLDAAQSERYRATAARVLARLDLPKGVSLPAEIEALARNVVLAPSLDRAEALASELRRAVQIERETRAVRDGEINEARTLLELLPDDAPLPLLQALERVAAGVDRFDASLRASLDAFGEAGTAQREQLEQQAAAWVLEESLRDLGYEVEGIEATLFVQGGAVHFRRPGWDNYFVRMRVDADEHTVNFNVVRARGDEETAERRRLDALAEDRWCAEFPKLLQTLAARGLRLDVTRRLGAGDVPVQVVEGASLPRIVDDEGSHRSTATPRSRPHP